MSNTFLKHYNPTRVWKAFRFLHTVFSTFRKKERFLFMRPLPPAAMKQIILEMGVCFIKMAQVLATRADFFTEPYLQELRTIHDEVAPMPERELNIMYRRAFQDGAPFAHFDHSPIASASIGQVHKALLPDGTVLAVKIRRLGIQQRVRADIRILNMLIRVFKPFFSQYTKNSLEAVIAEFSSMLLREIDLAVEMDNLKKFRALYPDCGVRFPVPYEQFSSQDAMVMSFETGVRVDDKQALANADIAFESLMEKLIIFYTEQMLIKGYFHCDPHPGNILVREDGELTMLDFGMAKRLPHSTRIAMIELVKAANEQNFELYIAACKRLGVVAASAPEQQLIEFAERMFDIFDNEQLNAASMQALAFDVLSSMKNMPFKLPQDVVYVMRVSALIEGLGTNYIENFNGIKDILPVLKKNLPRALGAEAKLFPTIRNEFYDLPMTMRRAKNILVDLSEGNLSVKLAPESIERLKDQIMDQIRGLGAAALLIVSAFFVLQFDVSWKTPCAVALFILGALKGISALRK